MQEKEVKFEFYNEKLFEFRKNKKLSQEELAEKVGVSRQSIYAWESGKSVPDIENMSKLCQILEVKTEELMDGLNSNYKNEDNNSIGENESNEKNENINITKNKFNNINNENMKLEEKKLKKKYIKRFILGILLIIFLVYLMFSLRKLIILEEIHSKIQHIICYNNYYCKIEYGKREFISDRKINAKYTTSEEINYKDNVVKVKRLNMLEGKDMTTEYIWFNNNTKEGYYYNVDKKIYSDYSGVGSMYDTGYIKDKSDNGMIGNGRIDFIFNALDPTFRIRDDVIYYVLEYDFISNGYKVKVNDYIFKETGLPYGKWYYSKDNTNTFQRFEIETGYVTDEDVSKPDFTGYTYVEIKDEE